MTTDPSSYAPLVLLVEDQEWTARSIESILGPHGYAVSKAYTGRQGIETAKRMAADLVLVEMQLPDMSGMEVFQGLASCPTITAATPLVLLTTAPLPKADRRAAFEAGAWAVLRPPFDSRELALRFGTWIRAKREADRTRDAGLVDPDTGAYNFNGLLRRSQEFVSDASRYERPISFVVFGPAGSEAPQEPESSQTLGRLLLEWSRLSDAVARVGANEFVVMAPGTDEDGASHLAHRVVDTAERANLRLRAGIYSMRGSRREPPTAMDLLGRATEALRRAQRAGNGERVHHFRNGGNGNGGAA